MKLDKAERRIIVECYQETRKMKWLSVTKDLLMLFFFPEWLNFHDSALGNLGDTRIGDLICDHKRILF